MEGDPMRRKRATDAEARALASLLTYVEADTDIGREVVSALRDMGAVAAPALADVLAAPRLGRTGRMAAAWLLGRLDAPHAASALERAVRDSDPDVARAARAALGREAALEPAAA